jgi:hypothetical protein
MYHYKVYGLGVAAPFQCPELWSLGRKVQPDVVIRFGEVNTRPTAAGEEAYFYETAPDRLLLSIPGVARFLTCRGEEIVIERSAGASNAAIRHYLLGSPLAVCALLRGLLPLHGSSISVGGRACVFLGRSGSGKSTIVAGMHQRGYRILSDDITVVQLNGDGRLLAFPGYPKLRLRADAVNHFGMKGLRRLSGDPNKFGKMVRDRFCEDALEIGRLYILFPRASRKLGLSPLTGVEKLAQLIRQTYVVDYLEGMSLQAHHLDQVASLARQVRVMRVNRPAGHAMTDALIDLIEKDFLE